MLDDEEREGYKGMVRKVHSTRVEMEQALAYQDKLIADWNAHPLGPPSPYAPDALDNIVELHGYLKEALAERDMIEDSIARVPAAQTFVHDRWQAWATTQFEDHCTKTLAEEDGFVVSGVGIWITPQQVAVPGVDVAELESRRVDYLTRFADMEAMRERLVLAILAGMRGILRIPEDSVGGSPVIRECMTYGWKVFEELNWFAKFPDQRVYELTRTLIADALIVQDLEFD